MAKPPPPPFHFTADPSTSPFAVPQQTYLSHHPDDRYQYIATGSLVFTNNPDDNSPLRILLIQRSANDSMPHRWEVPGGGCDDEDESILYSAARELWEETGLKASHIVLAKGDPHFFASRSGKRICKVLFVVDVEKGVGEGDGDGKGGEGVEVEGVEVRLDPSEHQRYVWASETEVREGKVGDVEVEFTTRELREAVLEAFGEFKGSGLG